MVEEIPKGTTKAAEADIRHWDIAPPPEYFRELARVSKNQIIWGGNYFDLPPTRCFLVWRKLTISDNFTMAMAEYAWTSFNDNAKVFDAAPQNAARFHPTQKPVELYAWIYRHYTAGGFKILDTHLGSGSSRIAAYDAGLDFVGCEINKTYFDLQEKRFAEHSAQQNLFLQLSM
ncbi:MAG: site-specific DNA-methyltransferase [Oscillospiraceae bacterium]|nr:site-specific DNA-methyltransferase [Oscillospiraceae bacterium]